MWRRYRAHLLLFVLALAGAQGWNRWNIAEMLRSPAAANVRDGRALISTDDASYLQGVDRLLGARADPDAAAPEGPSLRAPGYGALYLAARLLLDPLPAISALVWFQCLLYAFAAAFLWDTLLRRDIAARIRWPLLLAFALLPAFQGFLFHTLTEGVTPALGVLLLCCALRDEQAVHQRWLWAALGLWMLLMATRPALLWMGLALLPGLLRLGALRAALLSIAAATPMLLWWGSNCLRAGSLVGLHPVYWEGAPGINRPMHGSFWELAKSWGAPGDAFHGAMEPAFKAALACDTAASHADAFIALAPQGLLQEQQEAEIRSAFARWQRFNCLALAPALRSEAGTVPAATPEERSIVLDMERITSDWRRAHPVQHHLLVPLRVLKRMVAHSNLNLWVFQQTWRGHPIMEAWRWLSAILHAAMLAAAALAFLLRLPTAVRLISFGCAAYLFYLAYVQRGVEERYTLPVLLIGVACAAFAADRLRAAIFTTSNPANA